MLAEPSQQERARDLLTDLENRALADWVQSRRARAHVTGCFICSDPLSQCSTPVDCGIAMPEASDG